MRRELSQSASGRVTQPDPQPSGRPRRADLSDCRTPSPPAEDVTPLMSDEDLRRVFRSIEQELDNLHTQHVTRRKTGKSVRIDPAFVPLPDSDWSRSPSPAPRSSPSRVI